MWRFAVSIFISSYFILYSILLASSSMTVLPIEYNGDNKTVSVNSTPEYPLAQAMDLPLEVSQLNTLYKDLMACNKDLPPPPNKDNYSKQLSQMVQKMHQSASMLMKSQKFDEAANKFTIALGLALARSKFESFQLTLPEVVICILGRCDAYTNARKFDLALQDADLLCLLGPQIPDNHLRRAIGNTNMGLLNEAQSDVNRGLGFNAKHPILLKMRSIVDQLIKEENGDL